MQATQQFVGERIILGLVLILANLRASMFIFLFPDTSVFWGPAWMGIALWVILAAGLVFLLFKDDLVNEYLGLWRRNGLLAFFILLAFVSVIWSIAPVVTLFRGLELFFATLIGAYLGLRYRPEQFMEILFWFGTVLFIVSIALVFGAPKTGTMDWAPFNGAWRGIYWHRNHLASITALMSVLYLCRLLVAYQLHKQSGFLDGFFYLLSCLILYFAGSATGYILFLILHALVIGIWVWLQISPRLQSSHYILFSGGILLFSVLILLNLDFVFGLFRRDATMTGRLGLWKNELQFASQRLWLGHGFGAVWTLDTFREQMRQLVGWPSQPLIGDNGYLDILLHLGILGLGVFLLVLLTTTIRSFRYALHHRVLTAFFPLFVMVYAFFANITFSLFAETEVFVWLLIVAVLFMTTARQTYTSAA